jgi:chromosome partitioning protein
MTRNAKIILSTYNKGGVGKTTLAVHLIGVLNQEERGKILLVDCDSRPDAWSFFKKRRPQIGETIRRINTRLDISWNPPKDKGARFATLTSEDFDTYDFIVIDTDAPPEDTVAMIRNNLPNVIYSPINLSNMQSLRDLPDFLDTVSDLEKDANLEPGINYNPEFIIVPLGISEDRVISKFNEAYEKPTNCQVASAMDNYQSEVSEAFLEYKYLWEMPNCENTYEYFSSLLNLGL